MVVTAIDTFGNRTGDFFVQEPGGGEFSGIKVFGAPLDQVAALAVGDIVDITGAEKDEFALTSDMSGLKVTELKPVAGGTMTVTKMGTGHGPGARRGRCQGARRAADPRGARRRVGEVGGRADHA